MTIKHTMKEYTSRIEDLVPLDKKFVTVNMKRQEGTMIRVKHEVREKLKSLGVKGETYNDVLIRVLNLET